MTLPNGPPDHWYSDLPAVSLASWGDLPDVTVRVGKPIKQSLNQPRAPLSSHVMWRFESGSLRDPVFAKPVGTPISSAIRKTRARLDLAGNTP